jgi:4-hydroxybenzoate polyprenyltransferase
MRLHRPIGIFLLLWPTLWALWIASQGKPNLKILIIFILGVILMRSAGCVINDIADKNFDKFVTRTKDRPLVTNRVSVREAWVLFILLALGAFCLCLLLNKLTILLAFIGLGLTIIYPLMKRFTHLPQFVLGITFAWGVPMAFAAQTGNIPSIAWLLYLIAVLWPVVYDTMYAMVDKIDDLRIGVKSTAILFGSYDRLILGFFQIIILSLFCILGLVLSLKVGFYLCVSVAACFAIYQQYLIKNCDRQKCFNAFLNNHWFGLVIFIGIAIGYL